MKAIFTTIFSALFIFSTAQPVGDARETKVSSTAGQSAICGDGFTIRDVGKIVLIHQAGTQGDELTTTVTGYVNRNTLLLSAPAANTVTNATAWIGTDNTPLVQALIMSNSETYFPAGKYVFSDRVNIWGIENLLIEGNSAELLWVSANPNSYLTGTQPLKDLFKITYSKKITFDRLVFRNIGQEQARTNAQEEGKHYTALNGIACAYSRHFNKTANTGACVYNTASERISVTNCEAYRAGCLYVTSGAATGCRILNNIIKGYGSVAIFPGANSVCSMNTVDNTEAPALSTDDRAANLGTSHAYYVTGGFDRIIIENEVVIGVKNTAIQFNTSSGLPINSAIISNCALLDCPGGWLFLGGNHSRLRVSISGINLINCGGGQVDAPNGEICLNNILFDASSITPIRSKSMTIRDCRFKNLPAANVPGVFIIPKDGLSVSVSGCDFESTVDRAITIFGEASTIGSIVISGNRFNSCNVAAGYNGVTPTALSAQKIHIIGNDFWGEAIAAFYAVDCQANRFHMSEGAYSITAWMQGGDVFDIANNYFLPEGFNYCINIAPAVTGKVSIIRNDFGIGSWVGYGGKSFFQNTENLFR